MSVLSVNEWQSWICARTRLVDTETVPVTEALGRTLAQDIFPAHPLPLWDNSAMDGYALRAADLRLSSIERPVTLQVVGEVPAGSSADPLLGPGETVRIMTGAPVPTAADTVVAVEQTVSDTEGPWAEHQVTFSAPADQGSHIRLAGEDKTKDQVIAPTGQILTAARTSALAAAGIHEVLVGQLPRVAIVVTGSELIPPGEPLRRGQISESNSVLLTSLLREEDIHASVVMRSADDAATLADRLDELATEHDVVITTGGVGPGTHDVVRIAMEGEPEVRAVRIAVRPGQPQCAGRLRGGAWLFALPGNPVSAAVSFELFVRPALLKMQGRHAVDRLRVPATVSIAWRGKVGPLQVLPVSLETRDGALTCAPSVNPRGVSHAVGSHGATDGYALVPPERGNVAVGERVEVLLVRS